MMPTNSSVSRGRRVTAAIVDFRSFAMSLEYKPNPEIPCRYLYPKRLPHFAQWYNE